MDEFWHFMNYFRSEGEKAEKEMKRQKQIGETGGWRGAAQRWKQIQRKRGIE
jgi:hypothetical protein